MGHAAGEQVETGGILVLLLTWSLFIHNFLHEHFSWFTLDAASNWWTSVERTSGLRIPAAINKHNLLICWWCLPCLWKRFGFARICKSAALFGAWEHSPESCHLALLLFLRMAVMWKFIMCHFLLCGYVGSKQNSCHFQLGQQLCSYNVVILALWFLYETYIF